ncbi:MAG: 6-phosphogluconolactonase [Terriglobia bacterium]
MPSPEVRVFKDLEELSRQAAEDFVNTVERSDLSARPFAAALSGGSTPQRFCELLASRGVSLPWPRLHLFQVDERCVPPDDPRSNYRMLREAMLDRLPGVQFHRMQAEWPDREAAAASYENDLRTTLGTESGAWPHLDVIYLGLGEDGHTASLFPETAALAERRLAVCANFVPKLNMYRITLTLPVLNAAARVVFLVSGAGKAEILRQVLRTPAPPASLLPAQLVQPSGSAPTWYVDEAAARLL